MVTSFVRTRLAFLSVLALVLTITPTSLTSNAATSNLEIQAITDANAGAVDLTFNSKIAKATVLTYQITAKPNTLGAASYSKTFTRKVSGYISQRITPLTPGTNYKFKVTIKTTNKKVFNSADFSFYTASTRPNVPVITKAIETDADEAVVYFDAPNNDGQTPVLYYTANAYPGNATGITLGQGSGSITITGLTEATTYRFTVTAHNINGSSVSSMPSQPITTLATKIIRITPVSSSGSNLAAPAFSLSLSSETKTVGILSTGYSITSSGGTIDSYTITPALPAGLTFSTSNGLITGRATETRTATTHTITASNATGSASNTYRLRVTGDIGDIGPGGGRIFYYLAAGFNCGASFTDTGSATGEKCKYLEVAPNLWSGGSDPTKYWEPDETSFRNTTVASIPTEGSVNNSSGAVGLGYKYTLAIYGQSSDTSTAASAVRIYSPIVSGTTVTDWYLPTSTELNLMCQWQRGVTQSVTTVCSGGTLNSGSGASGFSASSYWASSQYNVDCAWSQNFGTGVQGILNTWKNYEGSVRPIRAF
jgi:hypothetical protein